jgi:ParB-like chromosome segregation protein Spo0J
VGDRYEVIAGNRRLQAARLAGLDHIPAIVRPDLDERGRLLVNLVENAQRVDLNATERVGAVRQLAAAGLGVREIARGTGLSAATVSRWIRIAGNKTLLAALDDGRIDLFRAMYLAGTKDPALLSELIELAPHYAPEDFYALVQQRSVATSNTARSNVTDTRKLVLLAERLASVQAVTPEAVEPLRRIVETASVLLQQALTLQAEGESRGSASVTDELKGATASLVNGHHADHSSIPTADDSPLDQAFSVRLSSNQGDTSTDSGLGSAVSVTRNRWPSPGTVAMKRGCFQ